MSSHVTLHLSIHRFRADCGKFPGWSQLRPLSRLFAPWTESWLYGQRLMSLRMDRANQVRQILSTRGLTLYRVCQQSAEIFGRSSRFYVPHNLYYDVGNPSLIPPFTRCLLSAMSQTTGCTVTVHTKPYEIKTIRLQFAAKSSSLTTRSRQE